MEPFLFEFEIEINILDTILIVLCSIYNYGGWGKKCSIIVKGKRSSVKWKPPYWE